MMENYDEWVEINHNPNSPYISDQPYRILIIGGSGSGNTNVFLNLIKYWQPHTEKIYLYVEDPFEWKCQLLINGREKAWIKELKNPNAFTDYWKTIDDVYDNLEDYNPTEKIKVLAVFDDMIADMEANKKLSAIVPELFLRGWKFNISLVFILQSYAKVPKAVRLNATQFIMKIPNKRELQQIASNHLADIEFKKLMKLYKNKDYTKEPFSYLVNDYHQIIH